MTQRQTRKKDGKKKIKEGREEGKEGRKEDDNITADTTKIQRIIRVYLNKLYANKLDNLEERDKFLETCNLSRLNHEEIKYLIDQ